MGDKLHHGFKAQAERLAIDIRQRLGLAVYDRLDPFDLAQLLGVPVLPLRQMVADGLFESDAAELRKESTGFSAVTVHCEKQRLIIYDDTHTPARSANDVVHELSHVVHDHPPRPAFGIAGCRDWDERYEQEATWQAGVLLAPRDGVFWFLRRGGGLADGALHFGISTDLFRWRVNATGASKVLKLRWAS